MATAKRSHPAHQAPKVEGPWILFVTKAPPMRTWALESSYSPYRPPCRFQTAKSTKGEAGRRSSPRRPDNWSDVGRASWGSVPPDFCSYRSRYRLRSTDVMAGQLPCRRWSTVSLKRTWPEPTAEPSLPSRPFAAITSLRKDMKAAPQLAAAVS